MGKSREKELVEALAECRRRWSTVDNGYCSICRRTRTYHLKNMSCFPSNCENKDCFSHTLDRLVEDKA